MSKLDVFCFVCNKIAVVYTVASVLHILHKIICPLRNLIKILSINVYNQRGFLFSKLTFVNEQFFFILNEPRQSATLFRLLNILNYVPYSTTDKLLFAAVSTLLVPARLSDSC